MPVGVNLQLAKYIFVQQASIKVFTALFDIERINLNYREISNIRRTKIKNLNDSRLVLHLSLPNLLKPGVK